jgi:O-antigen ligase
VTLATDRRSGTGRSPGSGSRGRRDRGAPVRFIQTYALLLVLIPPTHIIGPLGAVGTPATVVGLAALMLWGVAVLLPGASYRCRTVVPVRMVIGLLVGTILLGYTVLHLRHVPGGELLGSDRMLAQVLSWAGVALLAAEGIRDRGELYRVLRTLIAAVAVMAVVGFLQFRSGVDLADLANRIPGLHQNAELVSIQDREGFRRPAGTATHPIEFGTVIAMTLPLALHLARFDVSRSRARRWLPVAAIAVGVPVAVSRSAVLAAVVAGVVIFTGLEPRLRPRALGAAAAFIVAIYATTPGLLGTLRNLFVHAGSDSSITYRTNDYEVVGEYLRQSPLLGRGPGTFLADSYLILDNQYLLSAIEIGFLGLATVITYLLATAFLGRGARHRSTERAIRDLGQAMAATSLASAVAAFTFDAFSFLMYAGLVPLCLGVAGTLWQMQRTAEPRVDGGDPVEHGAPNGADEEFQWLATSAAEPLAIEARSSSDPSGCGAGESAEDGRYPRRVVVAIGAGLGVVLLAGVALAVGRRGEDRPDTAVAQMVTTTTVTPAGAPTTTLNEPATTAVARRPGARATAPSTGGIAASTHSATSGSTAASRLGSSTARSSSSPDAAPPTAAPSPTTTADPVPPPTTTVPSPTTTAAPTTTVPTTTTTVQPSTTTTVQPRGTTRPEHPSGSGP